MTDISSSSTGAGQTRSGEVLVVVGNPQPASRTTTAATLVGERLAELAGCDSDVVELAPYGPSLLSWSAPDVEDLKDRVRSSRGLVVATPTYKATYTGLTKLFLDRFDAGELAGLPTVAMMTGGSPAHSLAVTVHLTPVLTEIGCSCPASGLYVCGPGVDDPEPTIAGWFAAASIPLARALVSQR